MSRATLAGVSVGDGLDVAVVCGTMVSQFPLDAYLRAIVVVAIDGGCAIGEARISSRDTEGLTAAISSRFAST